MKNQQEFTEAVFARKTRVCAARRARRTKLLLSSTALILCCAILAAVFMRPATVQAANLMEGITPGKVSELGADEAFRQSQTAFALKLFQQSFSETADENTLISPLSVMLALAMTANGADGETKAQMEAVLGMPMERLNRYLYSYVKRLPSTENAKVTFANAIWFRDTPKLTVKQNFLQTNADYYGAAAYRAPFNGQTVKEMNNWVKETTDGMIDKIVDTIDSDTMLYLINALAFDAKWAMPYKKDTQVYDAKFTADNGTQQDAKMMTNTEHLYLSDSMATGFAKNYADGTYQFVALLPNEGISVQEYVASLTPEALREMLNGKRGARVHTAMPQFSYDYSLKMNGALSAMGMPAAFDDNANFSAMTNLDLHISEVFHKTHITVNEAGTRAAAVTSVGIGIAGITEDQYSVILDRPFVYLIVDAKSNIPIFMGTVLSLAG